MDNSQIETFKNNISLKNAQLINLDIILTQCIKQNQFDLLYKYLSSEIEFHGGIESFSKILKTNLDDIQKFLNSEKEPNIIILSKILNALGYKLTISYKAGL